MISEKLIHVKLSQYLLFLFFMVDDCRTLTQESCDISPILSQAMDALQDRPVLYK